MQAESKEWYELIATFERSEFAKGYRRDKEDREFWKRGRLYQNGELNELFRAFQAGYALGKCSYQQD